MRKLSIVMLVGIFTLSSCSFGSQEYEPKEYISTTGNASPGTETKIELEDGASIIIPANAIDDDVAVKVERNPEKSNNLPPLDENLVAVGDFYNFEIDGTINGPVDLVLPFDPEMVPENEAGVLVAAIPTENGWKYIPVIPDGNKVTLYTDQVGDPLIAWHFACTDGTDLSYAGQPENPCDAENAKKLVCDPEIPLEVIRNGDQFEITGSVVPVAKNFFGSTVSEPAANITVTLNLNLREVGSGNKISVQTDENGSFSHQLDASQLKEGWNWVFAKAECDPWWGKIVVESNGYAEFKYEQRMVEQPSNTTMPETTETPIVEQPIEMPIPAGAVLLPDFVGQNIDDAIDWLESNGFKYTWVDGSSTYDLGAVFRQAPMGGQYKIPHRTVVVLYRTTEKANSNLTPDLYANYRCVKRLADVKHTCDFSKGLYIKGVWDSCSESSDIEIELTSANSTGAPTFSNDWFIYWAPLNGENLFRSSSSTSEVDDWKTHIRKTSALELVPVQIESITIMGKTIDVQRYEGSNTNEYECLYNERGEAQGYTQANKYINYYDISTGLLVKWETFSKVTDCFFCDSNFVGATSNSIWEIFDTNQIIGK